MRETRLQLMPTFNDSTRTEYEMFLEAVRSRRLVAAQEYALGQELQLDREVDQLQAKLASKLDQLNNALKRMELLDERVSKLLAECEMYRGELGFTLDMKESGVIPSKKKRKR